MSVYKNQLSGSSSPYLLQHQSNPVHWWPWSDGALEQAKLANKPILVSVGYATCHWCHVMAHESFEDPDIAAIMNDYFICIKVDREERPDIDEYLMNAVQAMGVAGGWPLHCFLTPELKPFYGGTYFPPVRKYGRMSWPEILSAIHQAWIRKTPEVLEQAEKLAGFLKTTQEPKSTGKPGISMAQVLEALQPYFDQEEGGFGFGQKFPNISALSYLYKFGGLPHLNFIIKTVEAMSCKGMYDHLQGGFFRYTVDRKWTIPHFEKMAYDQSQILSFIGQCRQTSIDPYFLRVIQETIHFWLSEMSSEQGLFYAAMDADTEGVEGLYYLWDDNDKDLFQMQLNADFKMFQFNPMLHGNDSGFHLSLVAKPTVESLAAVQKTLDQMLELRLQRQKPSIDQKCILSWNALWVSAFADLYKSTRVEEYRDLAIKLMKQMKLYLYPEAMHPARYLFEGKPVGLAFLDDAVFAMRASLDVYEISFEQVFLEDAFRWLSWIESHFSGDGIFYCSSGPKHPNRLEGAPDLNDHSLPNPNACLASVYKRLYLVNFDDSLENKFNLMIQSATDCDHTQIWSRIGWFSLLADHTKPSFQIKCNNALAFWSFVPNINELSFVLLQDEKIQDHQLQVCTKDHCLQPMEILEFKSWLAEVLDE